MNVLFTCAGRRNYLLHYFKDALKGSGHVIAADMHSTAPAMAVADKAKVVPGVYEPGYVDALLDICKNEQVRAMISLNDLDLPILAAAGKRFQDIGTFPLVSSEKVIDICFDKWRTIQFASSAGLRSPLTFTSLVGAESAHHAGEIEFPLTIKPRWGSASIGIEFPESIHELQLAHDLLSIRLSRSILATASMQNLDQAILIQEKISGKEYGLDILNDFSGSPVQVYVKEKLAMRAGETDKAVLRNRPDLEETGFKIGKALGHIGNLDCDIFEAGGRFYLLEMNPRFGGGYPFSHVAGADYPAALIAWLEGRDYYFSELKRIYDQPFAKCDTLIRVG